VADADSVVDLFGDPVQARQDGPGRPPHVPTRETVNRVILGLARGWTVKDVAASIGISVPTLRKQYFVQLARRKAMALMMESVQLGRLNDQAAGGNVAAEKELMKALARGRLEQLADQVADRGKPERKAAAPKLGKKAEAKVKAGEVTGRFAPPPLMLN